MTPMPDIFAEIAKLEKEHRNLITRIERLEKQQGSSIPGGIANVVLLVCLGVLAGYLGFFPSGVDRLPLQAKRVEAEEFVVRQGNVVQARVIVDRGKVFVVDADGKTLYAQP